MIEIFCISLGILLTLCGVYSMGYMNGQCHEIDLQIKEMRKRLKKQNTWKNKY